MGSITGSQMLSGDDDMVVRSRKQLKAARARYTLLSVLLAKDLADSLIAIQDVLGTLTSCHQQQAESTCHMSHQICGTRQCTLTHCLPVDQAAIPARQSTGLKQAGVVVQNTRAHAERWRPRQLWLHAASSLPRRASGRPGPGDAGPASPSLNRPHVPCLPVLSAVHPESASVQPGPRIPTAQADDRSAAESPPQLYAISCEQAHRGHHVSDGRPQRPQCGVVAAPDAAVVIVHTAQCTACGIRGTPHDRILRSFRRNCRMKLGKGAGGGGV